MHEENNNYCSKCCNPLLYPDKPCTKCGFISDNIINEELNIPELDNPTNIKKCPHCYEDINIHAKKCKHCNATFVPENVKGWNWGAFFFTWIWGIANNSYLTLFVLIPALNFIWPIVCGIKGNEWAWQNRRWQSIEKFQQTQRLWAKWALGVLLFCFLGSFFGMLMISYIFVNSNNTTNNISNSTYSANQGYSKNSSNKNVTNNSNNNEENTASNNQDSYTPEYDNYSEKEQNITEQPKHIARGKQKNEFKTDSSTDFGYENTDNNVSSNNDADMKEYVQRLQNKINNNWDRTSVYYAGKVVIGFKVYTDGKIYDIKVMESSGNQELEQSALNAVSFSSPAESPPAKIKGYINLPFIISK
ncbi:MAG: TonB family protein [Candidatus Gastranaerophilales bacterium]|nr:TonB family protein [Candidatus Gastranaerophilales bacterium]